MKKYTNPIALFFLILLLSNCNQKNESNCDTNLLKLPQQAKDYFYFTRGSWWIYEEETTKIQDSIWIEGWGISSIGTDGRDLCRCEVRKCYEETGVSLQSKKYAQPIYNHNGMFINWYITKRDNLLNNKVYTLKENSSINNKPGIYRFLWDENGKLLYYNDFEGRIADTTNFNIGPFKFAEGLSYSYPKGAPTWAWQSKSIYAKGVGMVSYTLNDSTTWNLIKYHVVQ